MLLSSNVDVVSERLSEVWTFDIIRGKKNGYFKEFWTFKTKFFVIYKDLKLETFHRSYVSVYYIIHSQMF